MTDQATRVLRTEPIAPSEEPSSRWAYLAALTPIIFGTTYLLTSNFLPPGRPLLAALMRSLPTGLVLIIGSRLPQRTWLFRFLILSVLYASGLFPLLFVAATGFRAALRPSSTRSARSSW